MRSEPTFKDRVLLGDPATWMSAVASSESSFTFSAVERMSRDRSAPAGGCSPWASVSQRSGHAGNSVPFVGPAQVPASSVTSSGVSFGQPIPRPLKRRRTAIREGRKFMGSSVRREGGEGLGSIRGRAGADLALVARQVDEERGPPAWRLLEEDTSMMGLHPLPHHPESQAQAAVVAHRYGPLEPLEDPVAVDLRDAN